MLGELQVFPRDFVILIAKFVSASMICFAVGNCRDGVRVRFMIVKFCGWTVRTLRHGVLLACWMQAVGQRSTFNFGGFNNEVQQAG
jgi:hypothetical protein